MQVDKKASGGRLRFVLLEGIGRARARDDVPEPLVLSLLRELAPRAGA
ncbi:MAG: hypothetical protein RML56_08335 [Burkholderiales bacterium]|nr:hypothetical protein [Burkholderiales bacterium]